MDFLKPRKSVEKTGAGTGCILCGAAAHNKGLRLRIMQSQAPGHGGAIQGSFEIIDAGDNKHAPFLETLVGKPTDAAEVLRLIRQGSAMCVNVVNANSLTVEAEASVVR